jgi:hypothetical protein
MNNKTPLNQPTFRALTGLEAAQWLAGKISDVCPEDVREDVKSYVLDACKRSGRFEASASYPVSLGRFRAACLVIKVLPSMTWPKAFILPVNIEVGEVRIIGLDGGIGIRAQDGDEFHPLNCDIGVDVESAPDKIRELIGEPVLVPQRKGDRVVNMPKGESRVG